MNRLKISCIIPVYNASNCIENAVDSLLNQTYEDIEIIIIDDGSTDNSVEIIKRKYSNNEKVNLFFQENKGASYARNKGIELSKYPYIYFMDSDDYLEPNTLQKLVENIKGVDLVICNYKVINNTAINYDQKTTELEGTFDMEDIALNFFNFQNTKLLNVNWNKLYKKDIIEKGKIRFNTNMRLAEDAIFNLTYFGYIEKVRFIKDKLYNYVINSNQSIHKIYPDYFEMQKKFYLEIRNFLENKNVFETNKIDFSNQIMNEIVNSISYISKENINMREKVYKIRKIYDDNFYKDFVKFSNLKSFKIKLLKLSSTYLILMLFLIKNKLNNLKNFN